eukprot:scaffold164639_cov35-Tisochrysis_lutea.AAC.1
MGLTQPRPVEMTKMTSYCQGALSADPDPEAALDAVVSCPHGQGTAQQRALRPIRARIRPRLGAYGSWIGRCMFECRWKVEHKI